MSERIFSRLQVAVEKLRRGEVVAIPTETVYGLAGRFDSESAIRKIFELKERPLYDPLIVHIGELEQVEILAAQFPTNSKKLCNNFWPGPLTVVLPKKPVVSDIITAGLDTVAVRMPAHPVAKRLLRTLRLPLAAPSANKFSKVSPTEADHVRSAFGNTLHVLDGGHSQVGIESTVVSDRDGQVQILRPGIITKEELAAVLGCQPADIQVGNSSASPGNLPQHYQPKMPLIIIEESFSGNLSQELKKLNQSLSSFCELVLNDNPLLAARTLYADLRNLEQENTDCAIVRRTLSMRGGVWDALWDRLGRAATYRLS